ncbi:MAG: DUF3037 domain-containing protein [Nitritalea sp.]
MPEMHLYEYAVLRIVPRVEREEFVNVGVLICCKQQKFLGCKLIPDLQKVLALDPRADLELIQTYLTSIVKICEGKNTNSPITQYDAASRFRWLTANRSSMIQTSRPHGGLTEDLKYTLEELFRKLVD